MGVNDDKGRQHERGVFRFFASKLAPTENGLACIFIEL
jgi:hypothetical protein